MVQAHATARYVRTSAQKAGLVMDLIRGRGVNDALASLRFARKGVARDIEKVLRSAIANAQQKEGFGGDVERLVVSACYANQGPSMKRVRPAPMGRAFRIQKRTAHLTVQVIERAPARLKEPARRTAGGARAKTQRPRAGTTAARTAKGASSKATAAKSTTAKSAAPKAGTARSAPAKPTGSDEASSKPAATRRKKAEPDAQGRKQNPKE